MDCILCILELAQAMHFHESSRHLELFVKVLNQDTVRPLDGRYCTAAWDQLPPKAI